jgi:hypothetical protein
MLRTGRGISFEDIVFHIEAGDAVDIFAHPNQSKYPQQQIIVVCVEDYVYLVPFAENDEEIFLKTIIPSIKATKRYLGEKDE